MYSVNNFWIITIIAGFVKNKLFSVETVETVETVESVESVETVEAVESVEGREWGELGVDAAGIQKNVLYEKLSFGQFIDISVLTSL